MNLTLGTLAQLKAWLLPAEIAARGTFDAPLAALGRGMAARFEARCRRRFARADDTAHIGRLDTAPETHCLPRYPIEGPVALAVKPSASDTGPFLPVPGAVVVLDPAAGLARLALRPAGFARLSWLGGYWLDEDGVDAEPPDGATPLPDELHHAWLQQCAHAWARRQKLGVPANSTQSTAEITLDLLPEVAETLRSLTRLFP